MRVSKKQKKPAKTKKPVSFDDLTEAILEGHEADAVMEKAERRLAAADAAKRPVDNASLGICLQCIHKAAL